MSVRRTVAATLHSGSLILGVAGTAAAHECIVANRSAQGDAAAAAHAKVWTTLTLTDIFTFILPDVLQAPALTPSQLEFALATAAAQGIPSSVTTRSDKTIGEGSSNPNLADGQGIDHLADVYGQQLGGIYVAALAQ